MYDYQLLEAVYFRGTDVSKMSGRVYYADRAQRIVVRFLGTIMQILALSRNEREWIFTSQYPRSAFREFLYVCEYKLRAL